MIILSWEEVKEDRNRIEHYISFVNSIKYIRYIRHEHLHHRTDRKKTQTTPIQLKRQHPMYTYKHTTQGVGLHIVRRREGRKERRERRYVCGYTKREEKNIEKTLKHKQEEERKGVKGKERRKLEIASQFKRAKK